MNNFNPSVFTETFHRLSNNKDYIRVKLDNELLLNTYVKTIQTVLKKYKNIDSKSEYTTTTCSLIVSEKLICSINVENLKKLSTLISLKLSLFIDYGNILNELEEFKYSQIELAI